MRGSQPRPAGRRTSHGARPAFVAAALVLGLTAGMAAPPAGAASWRWGDWQTDLDSFLSGSFSIRTSDIDCTQIATINGGCNPLGSWTDPANPIEGRLLNADDGNLNWHRGDVFSVLLKGTHEIQSEWRNYGAFVRFTYFVDAIQVQGDSTRRTPLEREARFRGNLMQGGVNGAHFLLLDAYAYAMWNVSHWNLDLRVGNQALSWGESVFTQGGINAINGLDVTKIRLPGSEIKEALLPAPIIRLASNIWGPLSTEIYYQFGWRQVDIDPVGSFFASSDQVSRGAQGFFFPIGCGDPGTPLEYRNPVAVALFCGDSQDPAELTRFPMGIPRLNDDKPDGQGQFGAALRYYVNAIDTEIGAYYIRHHDRYPTVSYRGTSLFIPTCLAAEQVPTTGCDIGYYLEFMEDIDLVGLSFNTLLFDWAVGAEISYRHDQPTPVKDNPLASMTPGQYGGLQELVGALAPTSPGGTGGVAHGAVREKRIVAMVNGIYVAAPGTPFYGRLLRAIGASESNVVIELAVVNYPDMQLPREYYAGPLGVVEVDDTGFNYQIRMDWTYDRVLGSAWSLVPTFAIRHDAVGITPSGDTAVNEDVVAIGVSLEARYQNVWSALFSYSNSMGAGMRNGNNDRDFVGFSLSYAF